MVIPNVIERVGDLQMRCKYPSEKGLQTSRSVSRYEVVWFGVIYAVPKGIGP